MSQQRSNNKNAQEVSVPFHDYHIPFCIEMMAVIVMFCFMFWLPLEVKAEDQSTNEQVSKTYKVAYDPDLPPLHITEKESSGLTGFSVDILRHIAHKQGIDVEFIPMSKRESFQSIQNGEIDIILSASFSKDRAEVVKFTDPIISSSVGILVPEEEEKNVEGANGLSNSTVAIQQNTVEYGFLENIRNVSFHTVPNQRVGLRVLEKDRADAFIGTVITANYFLEQENLSDHYSFVDTYLLPVEYSLAVGNDNYQLLQLLNDGIRAMKSDGTYSMIYEDWFVNQQEELANRLWMAIKIIGTLLLVAIILFLIGIRWNRQLQKEVVKKTATLNRLNQSLQYQVEETKNSTQFQRQILKSSPRGIITIDVNQCITSINPKAKHILEVKQNVLEKPYETIPLLSSLLRDKFDQIMNGEEKKFLGTETVWKNKKGEELYLRYYAYPLYDFAGSIIGIIFAIEDNTAEQKMRLQVFEQEKNQALSRVVAGIAHEIRNPLSSIKTFVELLPQKFEKKKFRQQMKEHVPREIDRLNQLIEGLIDYARPKHLKKEVVDAYAIVNDCRVLFEQTAKNKGIELLIQGEEGCFMKVDPNQLKQIIINLVLNGIDAMEEECSPNIDGNTLTLSVGCWDHHVVIEVEDQGVGMSEESKHQAFEPFYTTKSKGTGLGLAIARQYVGENEGDMEIVSEPQQGTTVRLTFQREEEAMDVT